MAMLRYNFGWAILHICFSGFCYSQSTVEVRSSGDQRPLPYASVVNLTKGQLNFTDENGITTAKFDKYDSLLISYIGFQNLRVRIDSVGSQVYFLKTAVKMLEPVSVMNCRNWEKREYSNLNADTSERKFGGVVLTTQGMRSKIAIMLRPGSQNARLHSFSFWFKGKRVKPRSAMADPMIFSFYSIDETSMLPGELILNQQVIFHPINEGKQTIQIDSLYLSIPGNGMYVSIEYVFNEEYEFPMLMVDQQSGKESISMGEGINIEGIFSSDFTLAFFDYKVSSWALAGSRDKSTLLDVKGTIKFSAELSYCKD